ncbi:hypothetical protein NCCP2222_17610 [Sporosarcina sp. NCCP-2222]|uniref:DUF4870 domain-containing protein n=1 Tax=Sporosarcina sp. NCCP-2222 TaxID=2935073 RepID=UPI002089DC7A|nr:DUF4870 domain-containing protein [Sporosarcina sp. NCCP-2222]GKV55814.1 hypothetical protein NCCP2222_17610 [Sporosarcina sp. NCCP-2222]
MSEGEQKREDPKLEQTPVLAEKTEKTTIGLTPNVGGMLSYIFIIGIVFLFIEKESRFIRYHAFQSLFLAVAVFLINIVLGFLPIIGLIFSFLISLLAFAIMIFMMYQAYNGNYYKLPIIGEMAEKQVNQAK